MGVFPQYSRNGFHFATESYGGHYGPIFNEYIEQQNALKLPGAKKIRLESVLIGYVPNLSVVSFVVVPFEIIEWMMVCV